MKLEKTAENIFFIKAEDSVEKLFIEEATSKSYDLLKNGMCFNEISKDIMTLAANQQSMSLYLQDTLLDKLELMYFYWKQDAGLNSGNYVLFQYRNTIQKKYFPNSDDVVQWFLIPIFDFGGDRLHEALEIYSSYSSFYPFDSLEISDQERHELKWQCDTILFGVDCEHAEHIVKKSKEHVGLLLPYLLKKRTSTISENYYEILITR